MSFAHPAWLLLLFGMPLPWLLARHRGYLGYSDVTILGRPRRSSFLHKLPTLLLCVAYICLVVALAAPQQSFQKPTGTQLARDVIFGIDVSGSMSAEFDGKVPGSDPRCAGALGKIPQERLNRYAARINMTYEESQGTRLGAAAGAAENFICQSYLRGTGDRVGLLEFSDSPTWLWPLSGDMSMVFRQAQLLPFSSGSGTNFGGNPPGPLDFSAEMFRQIGQSKSRVFILVTDGEDNLNDKAKARLTELIRANDIHFYVISVGDDLSRAGSALEDQADIAQIATTTGGAVFQAQNETDLNLAVDTVDKLTRSPVQVETAEAHTQLFMYFAWAFVICFLLALAGEALVLRR